MGQLPRNNFSYIPFASVSIEDPFWSKRIEATHKNTLPAILSQLKSTGRWDVFRLVWKAGDPNPPHIFWDSDTAKFLEAACYSLVTKEDHELHRQVEDQIEWICTSQWDDGYVNSYFTLVEPSNRFTNLRDNHELYCAGHLLEAAIAHYQLTGKTYFLNTMTRYISLIQSTFGAESDKLHGYPGHEEPELALMRLYHLTNATEYFDLARYFIEERGQKREGVHYYEMEAKLNGVTLWPGHFKKESWFEYMQAGLPIREQSVIEGHAVRAMYFLAGASEVGLHLNDTSLLTALARLYRDMVKRKMYITYGIGSIHQWEGFGDPYELPNSSAYCETCASIGLVYLTHRLLKWDWNILLHHELNPGEIADVLEGALYNAVGAGVSIDGKSFFYVNPLETAGASTSRRDWFNPSCCPPNVARLFCSLGEYPFLVKRWKANGEWKVIVAVVLYVNCTGEIDLDGEKVKIKVTTGWPVTGKVEIQFENAHNVEIEVRLRIPSWAKTYTPKDGFVHYAPKRYNTETVSLDIPFPVTFIQPNPNIRQNQGRIAIRRGPFIYAMESADNHFNLSDARVIPGTYLEETTTILDIEVKRLHIPGIVKDKSQTLKFIPYWSWGNRGTGDIQVWCKTV